MYIIKFKEYIPLLPPGSQTLVFNYFPYMKEDIPLLSSMKQSSIFLLNNFLTESLYTPMTERSIFKLSYLNKFRAWL